MGLCENIVPQNPLALFNGRLEGIHICYSCYRVYRITVYLIFRQPQCLLSRTQDQWCGRPRIAMAGATKAMVLEC